MRRARIWDVTAVHKGMYNSRPAVPKSLLGALTPGLQRLLSRQGASWAINHVVKRLSLLIETIMK